MEFYTESSADVNYELWTRLGSFKDFKGTYEGWDLIAQGTVTGRGIGRYTAIPDETFNAVHIPGGGEEKGTRAFYITLDKKELVYKLGTGTDSDLLMHDSTADLEIYEGEGVLGYPFPDISEYYYYRYPRQYLGAIHYDRLPCKPYSAFGDVFDLPCPDMPTQSPTLPQPTRSPVTEPPTMLPVTEEPTTPAPIVGYTLPPQVPTGNPTLSPTVSMMPSSSPTSAEPTGSPIVPMRANVISVFRNAPDRLMTEREVEKFLEITTEFLIRKTQKSMAIEGIEVWHHKKTLAAGEVGVMSVNCASGCEEVAVEEEEKEGKEGEAAEAAASTEEGAEEESATDETASEEEEEEEDKSSSSETPVAESRNTRERTLQKNKLKNREPIIPQVFAMEITLILKISVSTLPLNLLGNMAAVAIDENQEELLALLNEQSAFYTYFKVSFVLF